MDNLDQPNIDKHTNFLRQDKTLYCKESSNVDLFSKDDNIPEMAMPIKKRRHTIASELLPTVNREEESNELLPITSESKSINKRSPLKRSFSARPDAIIDLTLSEDLPNSKVTVVDLTTEDEPSPKKPLLPDECHNMVCLPHIARFTLKHIKSFGGISIPITVTIAASKDGIVISGPGEDVKRAREMIQDVPWFGERLTYDCPQIFTYFHSDSWNDFVKVLESEIRCTIEVKTKTSEDKQTDEQKRLNCNTTTFFRSQPSSTIPQTFQNSNNFNSIAIRRKSCDVTMGDLPVPSELPDFIEEEHTTSSKEDIPIRRDMITSNLVQQTNLVNSIQRQDPHPVTAVNNLMDTANSFQNPALQTNSLSNQPSQIHYRRINVVLSLGDIVEDDSDVIVNGVTPSFDLRLGAISNAIVKKAGPQIAFACNTSDASNPLLRVTYGFKLKCKYVFHLVTPRSVDDYVSLIRQALNCAEQRHVTSIAFPALGTGELRLDPVLVSRRMEEAFAAFAASPVCYVKTIKVIVYNQPLYPIFEWNLIVAKELSTYGSKRVVQLESRITANNISQSVAICINSDLQPSLHSAVERVKKHMDSSIRKKTIDNELVMKLCDHDCLEIYEASVAYSASVTYNRLYQQIVLVGLPDNVDKLHDFVRSVWYELREAETVAKIASWQWQTSYDSFEDLPLRASANLERLYERRLQQKLEDLVEIRLYGERFLANFLTMTYQFNSIHGKIKRITPSNETTSLPPYWIDMGGRSLLKVLLAPTSPEYQQVINLFLQSSPLYKQIIKIERIQNPALYKQYMIKKHDVEKHLTSGNPVERELFHGTSEEDASKICTDGFDRGFAGKNAAVFGRGSYFAVNSAYSMNFTRGSNNSARLMFLAKVLTGDYCQGNAQFKAAPPKPGFGEPRRLFDSVVDNEANPTMFVVFKDSSVYPSYLIHFL